jgi:hypothetical protein
VALIVILFMQGVKNTILENQLTTMKLKTRSLSFLVQGRKDMQSMDMYSQVLSRVGRGVYIPCFLMVGLVMAQAVHDMIYLLTSY